MALNFPNSPTVGQIYTDTTSGFSYEWDGTVWKSYSPASSSQIKIIDDISGSFNGIGKTFALAVGGVSLTPASAQSLIITVGGVLQEPAVDYNVSTTNIVFDEAPEAALSFSGVSLGPAVPLTTIADGATTDGAFTVSGSLSATNLRVSGITTLGSSNGIGTVTIGIGTTALYVDGNARVTGILSIGQGTVTIDGSTNKIVVGTGITIDGNSGIITATSLSIGGQTVSSVGVGIRTAGGTVGTGVTLLDLRGAGISTVTASAGIATVNITGGAGGASVSISTTAPVSPSNGDLWFDSSDGNAYIWYASQNVWVVSQTYGY